MTALLEKVWAQASQLPDTDQDAVAARLLQTLTEFEQEKQQAEKKPRPQYGSAKGMFTLSPNFDEPLTDFEQEEPRLIYHKAGTATGTYWMAENFDAVLEDFPKHI